VARRSSAGCTRLPFLQALFLFQTPTASPFPGRVLLPGGSSGNLFRRSVLPCSRRGGSSSPRRRPHMRPHPKKAVVGRPRHFQQLYPAKLAITHIQGKCSPRIGKNWRKPQRTPKPCETLARGTRSTHPGPSLPSPGGVAAGSSVTLRRRGISGTRAQAEKPLGPPETSHGLSLLPDREDVKREGARPGGRGVPHRMIFLPSPSHSPAAPEGSLGGGCWDPPPWEMLHGRERQARDPLRVVTMLRVGKPGRKPGILQLPNVFPTAFSPLSPKRLDLQDPWGRTHVTQPARAHRQRRRHCPFPNLPQPQLPRPLFGVPFPWGSPPALPAGPAGLPASLEGRAAEHGIPQRQPEPAVRILWCLIGVELINLIRVRALTGSLFPQKTLGALVSPRQRHWRPKQTALRFGDALLPSRGGLWGGEGHPGAGAGVGGMPGRTLTRATSVRHTETPRLGKAVGGLNATDLFLFLLFFFNFFWWGVGSLPPPLFFVGDFYSQQGLFGWGGRKVQPNDAEHVPPRCVRAKPPRSAPAGCSQLYPPPFGCQKPLPPRLLGLPAMALTPLFAPPSPNTAPTAFPPPDAMPQRDGENREPLTAASRLLRRRVMPRHSRRLPESRNQPQNLRSPPASGITSHPAALPSARGPQRERASPRITPKQASFSPSKVSRPLAILVSPSRGPWVPAEEVTFPVSLAGLEAIGGKAPPAEVIFGGWGVNKRPQQSQLPRFVPHPPCKKKVCSSPAFGRQTQAGPQAWCGAGRRVLRTASSPRCLCRQIGASWLKKPQRYSLFRKQ